MSDSIRNDYGYIHPDHEADYKDGILPLLQLIQEYIGSWSNFINLISYRDQYDNYFTASNWVADYHRISFKDNDIINDFKSKQELHFTIRIEDLSATRYEAKAVSGFIAFVGAQSSSGIISAIIEHPGRYGGKSVMVQ